MLKRIVIVSLLLIFTTSCNIRHADVFQKDVVRLELTELSNGYLRLSIINGTQAPVAISGLLSAGYVQSPVMYEISTSDGKSTKVRELGSPIIVDLNNYRVTLPAHSAYSVFFSKQEFSVIKKLSPNQCYTIRAIYTPLDKTYSKGILRSENLRLCL